MFIIRPLRFFARRFGLKNFGNFQKMRRTLTAVGRTEFCNGNFRAFVQFFLIIQTFFLNFGRINLHISQFDRRMRQQIINMPADFFIFPAMPRHTLAEILHRAAGIDINSPLKRAKPQSTDSERNVFLNFYLQLITTRIHSLILKYASPKFRKSPQKNYAANDFKPEASVNMHEAHANM